MEKKAGKVGFGEGVLFAGEKYENLVVLGADITTSVGLDLFKSKFPDRFYSFGIAEQNIAATAAGMALSGLLPVFSTYGVFAAFRCADQVRISICYNNAKVIIGGAHAGISVGPDGATHQALEDIAVMRSLPNMTVLSPCDANQTKNLLLAAIDQIDGPVYIRFGREPMPNFSDLNEIPQIGKAQILREGDDIAIISTGSLVWESLQAADFLTQNYNINALVINVHTIKPIDIDTIFYAANKCKLIITAEEHQKFGGLFSAISEVCSEYYPVPIKAIAMNDRFGESGNPDQLMQYFGFTYENIIKTALNMLKKGK
jgi:transketolase